MKKVIILLFLIVVVIIGLTMASINYKNKSEEITSIHNFSDCVAAHYPIQESYPRQCKTRSGQSFVEDIGNEFDKLDIIRLDSPRPNQEIASPLLIEGEARGAWFFEASFPVKIYDENNNLLAQTIAQAQSDWMTENFVRFKAELNFNYSTSTKGTLVLEKDNPSGLAENSDDLRIPVVFSSDIQKTKVKVYFNNNNLDPEISCTKVFPVEREITKTPAIARAALEELLMGPSVADTEAGYTTSLNSGNTVQSLIIENGVAKVDFNKQLEAGIAGSCKVSAIAAQIKETLLQFSTVSQVIISIDGRTEDILQP